MHSESFFRREPKITKRRPKASTSRPVEGGRTVGYFAVLGAALSPDLSILPIFVLAVPAGFNLAIDTAVVFGSASMLSLLIFVLLGSWGLDRVFEKAPPKYNAALVGFVVAAVGVYVVLFG